MNKYKTILDISKKGITSLKDYFEKNPCPPQLTSLFCDNNELTSLEGCPQHLTKLMCSCNKLKSLKGCPPNLTTLYCSDNQLTSLKGCPPNLTTLYCYNNPLKSLLWCPEKLKSFNCNENNLKSFKNFPIPLSSSYISYSWKDNPFVEGSNSMNEICTMIIKRKFSAKNNIYFSNKVSKINHDTCFGALFNDKIKTSVTLFTLLI